MTIGEDAVQAYLKAVRGVGATGLGTEERSFYPAVNALLTTLGGTLPRPCVALSEPAGVDGNMPDVGIYERASEVIALPVEVKPASHDIGALLGSDQALRYAQSFGGGQVLVTNLRSFALGEVDSGTGKLVELERWVAAATEADLNDPAAVVADDPQDLIDLVRLGCQTHATLTDPRAVAWLLAKHAKGVLASVEATGDPRSLLAPVAEAFQKGLNIELDDETFAATVVQTLMYGLFAAWVESDVRGDYDWRSAAYRIDVPIFAEVLHACLRPTVIRQCDLFPRLDAAARVLDWVDRDQFVSAFNGRAIEYFYEPFLAHFDPDLRDALGVWYTPRPIADYQVARVDHHLRTDLGIEEGLADQSVVILDPAAGTGTYLTAVLDFIYERHLGNGEPPEVAAARTRDAALSRVVGFEVLPAAFVISHLHLSRHLAELDAGLAPEQRLRIYLTNSLTGWGDSPDELTLSLFPDLMGEVSEARAVKRTEPVLAVIGNPPYHGYSTAETEEEKEMIQPWVAPLWPVWGLRKHRMNDLYVRFWRVAIERVAELTGRGVISFISNRQWLGGRSYPTMREAIATSFQHVVVDDLHGDVHDTTHTDDGSVFTTATAAGIKVGTAIVTAVRTGPPPTGAASKVRGRDLRGTGAAKRDQLDTFRNGAIDNGLSVRPTSAERKWKLTSDAGDDFPPIDEYFKRFFSGVQPVRDEAVLDTGEDALRTRMQTYFDPDIDWPTLTDGYPGFAVERARYDGPATRKALRKSSAFDPERVVRYLHRPMDPRWLYWEPDHKLLNEARRDMIPYWLGIDNQRSLVVPQTRRRPGAARPVATSQVPGFASVDPDARVFCLYAPGADIGLAPGELGHDEGAHSPPTPNIAQIWIEAARSVGVTGTDNEVAETVFYAILGVTTSADWLNSQPLQDGEFPTVPLPKDLDALTEAARVGKRYHELVDPDMTAPGVTTGKINPAYAAIGVPDSVAGTVALAYGTSGQAGGKRVGADVLWDDAHGWRNIPDTVWTYQLGGFPPLAKWLSYRVGQKLTPADRETITSIARRIAALQDLGHEANAVFQEAVNQPLDIAHP